MPVWHHAPLLPQELISKGNSSHADVATGVICLRRSTTTTFCTRLNTRMIYFLKTTRTTVAVSPRPTLKLDRSAVERNCPLSFALFSVDGTSTSSSQLPVVPLL